MLVSIPRVLLESNGIESPSFGIRFASIRRVFKSLKAFVSLPLWLITPIPSIAPTNKRQRRGKERAIKQQSSKLFLCLHAAPLLSFACFRARNERRSRNAPNPAGARAGLSETAKTTLYNIRNQRSRSVSAPSSLSPPFAVWWSLECGFCDNA